MRVGGQGQPLLLIGGLWSQAPMFDDVLPLLDGFRTIAFDPPGIGRPTCPHVPTAFGDWPDSRPASSPRWGSAGRTSSA